MNSSETPDRLDLLRRQATNLPELPGVYLMRDEEGEVIYVGKAKALRARVKTYFMGGDGRLQIEFLLQRLISFETIVTQTEEQAFLLERDLITKYKPRYNIRLKDDKAYLSIRIDQNAEWPRLELVRRTENDGASYFGPYAFSSELRSLLEIIKRVIPLRSCSDTVLYNRQRPCLEYQIKRCVGPCTMPVDRTEYLSLVKQAIGILEGKSAATIRQMTERMEEASQALRFEEAAAWRDRIEMLKGFHAGHSLVTFRGENRDVFGIFREGIHAVVCVLIVRSGRIVETKNFPLNEVGMPDDQLLEAAVEQFYEGKREIPDEILVPREFENQSMVEAGLRLKRGRALSIHFPQRGSRARLLEMADLNARQAYLTSLTFEAEWNTVAAELARIAGMRQIPRRVECVDISNLQGSDIVGAIVAFMDGVADKSGYRRYNISQQGKPNDFASMHEVVGRRLQRGRDEENLPDLLVIDGGPGQLSMALQARDELHLSVDIIALAKMRTAREFESQEIERKPERVYIPGREDPIELAEGDAVTRFLSRLRDEVHRFVITFHRQKRAKRVFKSKLDDISGVGPERRARLLKHYKSTNLIAEASVEEVARIGRMPLSLATKIQVALSGDSRTNINKRSEANTVSKQPQQKNRTDDE